MRFILASASDARRQTLLAAGIEPLVQVAEVHEDALLAGLSGQPVTEQVLALARAKAQAVAGNLGISEAAALVLGCDSMLEAFGEVWGKPHTSQLAKQRIARLSGARVTLHTGHWLAVVGADGQLRGQTGQTASTIVSFSELSPQDIAAYVETGEPLEVAGSFTIDGRGGAFIRGIEGDYHNVVGLSLPLVRNLAAELDIWWPSLWVR